MVPTMTPPWQTLETVAIPEGPLELRRRGDSDFQIVLGGRVLMTSSAHRAEDALARFCAARLADRTGLRVLISGLGLAYTLRATLDAFPADTHVTVAELSEPVARWCKGPLAGLTGGAANDPRVTVIIDDIAKVIAGSASSDDDKYDAILLDLAEGPTPSQRKDDPFYGAAALSRSFAALAPGGVMAVWSADPDAAFAKRFATAGFAVTTQRATQGGRIHAVYLGVRR